MPVITSIALVILTIGIIAFTELSAGKLIGGITL
jgi:hypothetical protein